MTLSPASPEIGRPTPMCFAIRSIGGSDVSVVTFSLRAAHERSYWPRALTRYSVVPHPRGLTAAHRLSLERPELRAMAGSQAQSGWRPSWAKRLDQSQTRARLTSPGSKQHDGLPESSEPRTNARKQNQSLPRMLPSTSNTDLNSSLTPNQPMERTPRC